MPTLDDERAETQRASRAERPMRRLRAMVAPVAADAGSVIRDLSLLDVARAITEAFDTDEADGGLTRAQLAARTEAACDQALLDARIDVFVKLGMLHPWLDKKHQQRYVLDPSARVGLLAIDRLLTAGGIDELLLLLDRTRELAMSGRASSAELGAHIRSLRTTFRVIADDLRRAVEHGTLAELFERRDEHDRQQLMADVRDLNEVVSANHRDLDMEGHRLLTQAQRYLEASAMLVERVLDEGGSALDFSILPVEDYVAAALTADLDTLACVASGVVFDPASPWLDAASILEAAGRQRTRPTMWERPAAPPPATEQVDPLVAMEQRRDARRQRQTLAIEQLLQGAATLDVTSHLRANEWRGAAIDLALLFAVDRDVALPYAVQLHDSLVVDPEAFVTHASRAQLDRGQSLDLAGREADRINDLAGEKA